MKLFHQTIAGMETGSVAVEVCLCLQRVSNKVSCSGWKSAAAETERLFPVCLCYTLPQYLGLICCEMRLVLISFKCNLSISEQCF